ncbi:MAG: M48 family metalloprotease [Armatimonadota bacterium]
MVVLALLGLLLFVCGAWAVRGSSGLSKEISAKRPEGDELEARRFAAQVLAKRSRRVSHLSFAVVVLFFVVHLSMLLSTFVPRVVFIPLLLVGLMLLGLVPFALDRYHVCRMFLRPPPKGSEYALSYLTLLLLPESHFLAWVAAAVVAPSALLLVKPYVADGLGFAVTVYVTFIAASVLGSRLFFAIVLRGLRLSPCEDESLIERVNRLAALFPVEPPRVLASDLRECYLPFAALSGNIVVVPRSIPAELTSEEVDSIIAHEIAHIANGDLRRLQRLFASVTITVAVLLGCAVWLMLSVAGVPSARWAGMLGLAMVAVAQHIRHRVCRRQELHADALAAAAGTEATVYASALAKLYALGIIPSRVRGTHPSLDERLRALGGSARAEGEVERE